MRKRAKLTTAIFLAASVNVSYGGENCLPPDAGMNDPMKIFECFQGMLDTQQQQIAELKEENQRLRQKTDVISVDNGKVTISVGKHELLEISRTMSNHQGIYVRSLKVLGSDDKNQNYGDSTIYGGLRLEGDKWHTAQSMGPILSFHPKFPNSDDNRHYYFALGDTHNNRNGVAKNDFVVFSWQSGGTSHVQNLVLKANGNVGIGTAKPTEKLQVSGNIKANAFNTGDIFFEKDGKTLWQMFEDEQGLYVKHIKTGNVYRLMLEKIQ